MARIIVIGAEQKQQITAVLDYAERNIVDHARVMRMANGVEKPVGDVPQHVVHIPKGVRVVFSYEIQKGRKARHISVSVDGPDKYPSVEAVNLLMTEFGFRARISPYGAVGGELVKEARAIKAVGGELVIWPEKEARAINVLEFVEPDHTGDGRNPKNTDSAS